MILLGCIDEEGGEKSIDGKMLAQSLIVTLASDRELFAPFVEFGYDVVDAGCLSALTNIGLRSDEVAKIAPFRQSTNDYGLIRNHADAVSYAKLISTIAAEHAPFFPVRVLGGKREVAPGI